MAKRYSRRHPSKVPTLVQEAINLLVASLSSSSRKFYAQALANYKEFVSHELGRVVWFPATSTLALYMAHLVKKGNASSMVASNLSAIAFYHKLLGFQDSSSEFFIRKMRAGMIKIHKSVYSRIPVSVDMLKKLIDSTQHVCH